MLVRIIRESKGENPDYNPSLPVDSATNCPTRVIPVGTEIEHPEAWRLCLPDYQQTVAAEPVDEDAKAAVAKAEAAVKFKSRRTSATVQFPTATATPRKKPAEVPPTK